MRTLSDEEERRRRAFHEAGHAVVAHSLGHGVERITLEANSTSDGSAVIKPPRNQEPHDVAIIAYAGFFGEKRSGVDVPKDEYHCRLDDEKASKHLRALSATLDDYRVAMSYSQSKADHLLGAHREGLEALAAALQARTTLDDPAEIAAIIDGR